VADKDAVPHLLGTPPSISSSLAPTFTPSIKNKSVAETNINTSTTTATATANGNDDQFEDDLKKAIEMSLKESEQQSKISNYFTKKDDVKKSTEEEEEDANLAAAIAASLKDMNSTLSYSQSNANTRYNNNELSPIDMENIQLFSTLMQRVRSLGGDISGDTQINKLYTQIGALQPKLVKTLDETCQKHGK
jgi:growth factor-regulated tyrosine kinase substrate